MTPKQNIVFLSDRSYHLKQTLALPLILTLSYPAKKYVGCLDLGTTVGSDDRSGSLVENKNVFQSFKSHILRSSWSTHEQKLCLSKLRSILVYLLRVPPRLDQRPYKICYPLLQHINTKALSSLKRSIYSENSLTHSSARHILFSASF